MVEIHGWYSTEELGVLERYAGLVPEGQMILEVGSFRGRSLQVLARSGRTTVGLDPMRERDGIRDKDREWLAWLVDQVENMEWVRGSRWDYVPAEPIGLLHIDGDHTGRNPLLDYKHFAPYLGAGAIVVFHDFTSSSGIPQLIRGAIGEGLSLKELGGKGTAVAFEHLVEVGC